MSFLNPLFLLGSGAIAAPIIIHLLNRQRYKKVEWAAMRFVLEAIRRTHRRLRLEELLLLLLRCALILLLVLALARPYVGGWFPGAGAGNQHAVIVLDASYSMAAQLGHRSVFERARQEADGIIQQLEPGDKLTVVALTHEPYALQADPTSRFEEARSRMWALKPTHSEARLEQGLELLRKIVRDSPLPSVNVYVFTDNQRRFWRGIREGGLGPRRWLKGLGRKARVFVIDVGEDFPANLTLSDLRTSRPIVARGFPFRIEADVTNYGARPVPDAEVTLSLGGRRIRTVTVRVDPGKTRTVSFDARLDETGSVPVTVSLAADALKVDNERSLILEVREGLPVLVVDPTLGERGKGESWFIRFALNPQFRRGRNDVSPMLVKAVTPEALGTIRLEDYPVVHLVNAGGLTPSLTDRLERYVEQGGGLVMFLGGRTDAYVVNRRLYRDGRGFLPARLTGRRGDPEKRRFVHVQAEDVDHPVLRYLKENHLDLTRMYVFQYIASDDAKLPDGSTPLARYVSAEGLAGIGTPAILERRFGKGRVILFTTSPGDPEWSQMFRDWTFIVLVQEFTRYLAAGDPEGGQMRVGEKITKVLPEELFGKDVLLLRPGKEPVPQRVSKDEQGVVRVEFDDTSEAGVYTLQRAVAGDPGPEDILGHFAVNVDPGEGDLRREEPAAMKSFLSGLGIRFHTAGAEGASPVRGHGGKEYWKEIVFVLLLLMGVEMFFAYRFGSFRRS